MQYGQSVFRCDEKSELKSAAYRKYRTEMMTYYALAEEPLEQVRRLSPDKASRWAPLLYQVYLNQNKGAEFDEMERIIRDIKKPENRYGKTKDIYGSFAGAYGGSLPQCF